MRSKMVRDRRKSSQAVEASVETHGEQVAAGDRLDLRPTTLQQETPRGQPEHEEHDHENGDRADAPAPSLLLVRHV